MKKLVMAAVILSLASVACNAFKDNYGDGTTTSPTGVSGSGSTTGGVQTGNFAGDTTVCEAVKTVTVKKADESGIVLLSALSTAKDSDKVTSKAEKIGTFTTKITILTNAKEAISFIIKQTGEDDFVACNVSYDDLTVKSGTITIDTFNAADKDGVKVVNAGSIDLEFPKDSVVPALTQAANEAVAVMGTVAGTTPETTADGNVVEGTYYADALKVTVTK